MRGAGCRRRNDGRRYGDEPRGLPGWSRRQLESEDRARTRSITVNFESAPHFASGQRTDVQAEAVSVFLGRKAVPENAAELLRCDAHAIVPDADAHWAFLAS